MFCLPTLLIKIIFLLVLNHSLALALKERKSEANQKQASSNQKQTSIPNRNFAVVVDIGSTGSRIHAFEYTYEIGGCKGEGKVSVSLPERTTKIRPGLSTFVDLAVQEPSTRSSSRKDLIFEYLEKIRKELDLLIIPSRRSITPVWLYGTGGLRHYSDSELNDILTEMREVVSSEWNEYKTHPDWIDTIDGELEGLYSWFVLNQLLGRSLHPQFQDIFIDPHPYSQLKGRSVVLVELGGASAQVVLQLSNHATSGLFPNLSSLPNFDTGGVHSIPNHPGFAMFNFCNTSMTVFSRSFQGFGRQLAFQRFLAIHQQSASLLPCLAPDVVYPNLDIESLVAIEEIGIVDDGKSVGSRGILNGTFEVCKKAVDDAVFGSLGNFTAEWLPLPFEIDEDVAIVGTENFYHFHKMVENPTSTAPHLFSINSLRERAKELCQLKNVSDIVDRLNPKAEFEKATTACFGLTYMASLLDNVLRLDHDREVEGIRKVNSIDVAWPAGHILLDLPNLIRQYPDLAPTSESDAGDDKSHDEL